MLDLYFFITCATWMPFSRERNKKESRHFHAGTLMVIYVFAKVGIFFDLNYKKNQKKHCFMFLYPFF